MQKDNWIKWAIVLISMIIIVMGITFWWRAPIFYGDWNKQTIYVGFINTWHSNFKDSHAHAMWIDDDGN